MGEQSDPDASRIQRKPAPDAMRDRSGGSRRQPLDEDRFFSVTHSEKHVLLGHPMKVLHVRQGRSTQAVPARRERRYFQQSETDHEIAITQPLQCSDIHELRSDPESSALR